MGPIVLPGQPQAPRKRRWGWFLFWTVLVFVGGMVAGFAQKESLIKVGRQVGINLGASATTVSPSTTPVADPSGGAEPTPVATAETSPAPAARAPKQIVKVEPVQEPSAPERAKAEPEKAVAHASAPSRAMPTESASESASAKRAKSPAKAVAVASSGRKPGSDNPFGVEDSAPVAKPAAAPLAKPEPAKSAGKTESPKAARSSDSLDSLMVDMPSDGKSKKRDSRDIDALLKDVQKPRAEPAPKKEAPPPPAQSLSAADISRVMSGVKVRSKDCANKLGEKGMAELKITVARSGAVSDVHLGGKLANTPVGACIEKVTRAAVFPPSSGLVFDYRVDAR